jgi:hypothetical protein
MRRIETAPGGFRDQTLPAEKSYTVRWKFRDADEETEHNFVVHLEGSVAEPLGFGKGGASDPRRKDAIAAMQKAAQLFAERHWESLPLNGELELTAAELRPFLPRETRRKPTEG